MTSDSPVAQVHLPGQAGVADGPIDHTGMYCMHFAFRRDLTDLTAAAAATPLDDVATWRELARRWSFFAEVLHHHHTVEDEHYWPALAAAVAARGDDLDRALVADMETEHAELGPLLAACERAVGPMPARPGPGDRALLLDSLRRLHRALEQHLAHEEAETLPLVQRVMEPGAYAQVERAIGRAYPVRLVPMLVPWVLHGMPTEALRQVRSQMGPVHRALHALLRRGFERRQRRTFRYAGADRR